MRILVLGGGKFVGRHFVEAAEAAGHAVTLLNRGQTNADNNAQLPRLTADRLDEGAFSRVVKGQQWDVVADFCAYFPRAVDIACRALADKASTYLLISTISVYDTKGHGERGTGDGTGMMVDSPLLAEPAVGVEEVTGETYGGLKVGCERALASGWTGKEIVVRPGLVVGPYDHTNRFHHWVRLIAAGGRVPVPPRLEQPIQVIDGRDLAAYCLGLLGGSECVVNGVGPEMTLGEMFGVILEVSGSGAELVPTAQLDYAPLVLAGLEEDALFRVRSDARCRPLAETVRDVLAEV